MPANNRTTAIGWQAGHLNYAYWAQGGMSWTVPYVAGALALGWEADPNLTNENAVKYLVDSATPSPKGGRVINPTLSKGPPAILSRRALFMAPIAIY